MVEFTNLDTIGPEIVDDFYTSNVLNETHRLLAVLEPQKWEYLVIENYFIPDTLEILNKMGQDEWELAFVDVRHEYHRYYFKRPKVEK
jgi:hypothetical protein